MLKTKEDLKKLCIRANNHYFNLLRCERSYAPDIIKQTVGWFQRIARYHFMYENEYCYSLYNSTLYPAWNIEVEDRFMENDLIFHIVDNILVKPL